MKLTDIEWTDYSSNPLKYRDNATGKTVWACEKVSPGCAHCYAEGIATRWGKGGPFNRRQMQTVTPFVDAAELRHVLTAKTIDGRAVAGSKCFLGDMTDLFGEWVGDDLLDKLLAMMAVRPDVTFQVLTKRPERMAAYLSAPDVGHRIFRVVQAWLDEGGDGTLGRRWDTVHDLSGESTNAAGQYEWTAWNLPLPNVWLGTSVENQKAADERIPHLLRVPAAVRFLSCEPLLEAVNIRGHMLGFAAGNPAECVCGHGHGFTRCPNYGGVSPTCHHGGCKCDGFRRRNNDGIGWVIVGGESGRGSRPMNPAWVRSLRDQCKAVGVPFFFKQHGEYRMVDGAHFHEPALPNGTGGWQSAMEKLGKKSAGRLLDGREWNEFPEVKTCS